ncbi:MULTISPECIES: DUF4435 domain-containing protein [unclassified Francisella]|uniref:DUF4435 domain-containing protein n=1 Tax=unclassified Francisella TaxID=2610885 RepID=UPI002E31387D|nr:MULTISPECIES: DUF4435 domain-containing protein [unclassified Francisella]MED7819390.1 DUF4435 domain-containing protein [Francisella sp. 19S2-4]MED7830153.1 DUF4435 domain-containing protein [Francisella sp. 19S2-10]
MNDISLTEQNFEKVKIYINKIREYIENNIRFNQILILLDEQERLSFDVNEDLYTVIYDAIKFNFSKSILNDIEAIKEAYSNPQTLNNYKKIINNQFTKIIRSIKANDEKLLDNLISLNSSSTETRVLKNTCENFSKSLGNICASIGVVKTGINIIQSLDLLKNIGENLVLIGSNGSGKSTFSRNLKQKIRKDFNNNSTIVIPAQRAFFSNQNSSIPLVKDAQLSLSKAQKQDRLHKKEVEKDDLNSDFQNLINYLIAEDHKVAHDTYTGLTKNDSILKKTIRIWESLINHITLKYDGQEVITASNQGSDPYPFMSLSDGEKSIFYCIANVLTVEKNGYIIVDEPESHLNMNIVNKLWDKLEEIRSDCQFIYLTHIPGFATARNNARIFWVRNYNALSNHWDYDEISNDNGSLPKELVVELIGSKKPILFCEGNDRTSLDYKLYSILFTNYTVIPAGGHKQVTAYCKSFNNQKKLFCNEAVAIVDKDYYSEEYRKKLLRKSIFMLDVREIESLLCDEEILKCFSDNIDDIKKQIFKSVESEFENEAMAYTKHNVSIIYDKALRISENLNDIKNKIITNIESTLEPDKYYSEHKKRLEGIVSDYNYDQLLKHFDGKKIINIIEKYKGINDYTDQAINEINNSQSLLKSLENKYFLDIKKLKKENQ